MHTSRNRVYIIIILSFLTGLASGRALFFNIAYVLLALIVLSAIWALIAISGVSLRRSTRTRRSRVGEAFTEQFIVHNISSLPKLWLEVRDYSDLPIHSASHVTPAMPAHSSYEWRVNTPCIVRGEFRLGPVVVSTGDPFGFFQPTRRIDATQRIVVYPRIMPLERFPLPGGVLTGGDPQRFITQNVTTNAAGVRDYVSGDSINRMHWRTTARRNKLTVKEFELDPQVDIWLFVDFSVQSLVEDPYLQRLGNQGIVIQNTSEIPRSTEEYAVVVAASLANYFINQKRAIGFSAYVPHREVYPADRGERQLVHILETLAVARSVSNQTLNDMLAQEAYSFSRGTTLILITSSLDLNWLTQVQMLTQRGVKPVCIFIDPATFGSAYASDGVRARLHALKVPTHVIQAGADLATQLAQRTF